MKFCKSCGAELVDDAVVCPKCGVAVEEVALAPTKHNVCGIISFVCAMLGIIVSWFTTLVGGIFTFAAFVLGIVGIVLAKKKNEKKGFAVAGLVLSLLNVILIIVLIVVLAALLAAMM